MHTKIIGDMFFFIYKTCHEVKTCSCVLMTKHMNTKIMCDMCYVFKKHVTCLKCVHVFCQKTHKHQNDTSCVFF